jgi:hypothetical protein
MVKFRQCLDSKLKETFDCRQRDFLEATKLWNEQEGVFVELSNALKRAFISVVEQAAVAFNTETNSKLVVRKNFQTLRRLSRVTIFKDEAAAKRYALQTFGKTKICIYWAKGHCFKGDECTYAHGEHEIVSDFSPKSTFQEPKQQPNATPDGKGENEGAKTLQDSKAIKKAAPSSTVMTGVVSGLVATIKTADDTMTRVAEKVPPEVAQDEVAEELVPSVEIVEIAREAEVTDTLVVSESLHKASKDSVFEATNKTVNVATEDEFDRALESAMAEALEALGVPVEASTDLEATEQKVGEGTAHRPENMLDVIEQQAKESSSRRPEKDLEATEQQAEEDTASRPRDTKEPDNTLEVKSPSDESAEKKTAVSTAESSVEWTEKAIASSNLSLDSSDELPEPMSTAADAKHGGSSFGIGRWGDYDSSSDSDDQ